MNNLNLYEIEQQLIKLLEWVQELIAFKEELDDTNHNHDGCGDLLKLD